MVFHNHAIFHHDTNDGYPFESEQPNEDGTHETVQSEGIQEDNDQQPNYNAALPPQLLPTLSPDETWLTLMRAVLTAIRQVQPGHLKPQNKKQELKHQPETTATTTYPPSHLMAVTPMPPAPTEMFPQGTDPVLVGHYSH